jgi:predicted nucleic acid-binding protein
VSVLVIDASVVIKWFIPEVDSAAARRLLDQDHTYFAPDLLFAELANITWKKVRGGHLSHAQGERLMADFGKIAVETISCRALARDAYSLAVNTGRSGYDALYLALAMRLDTQMVTADERLANALSAIPAFSGHIASLHHFR